MNLIGGRWRLLIVSYLLEKPKRFSGLRRDIPGISQRMLTMDLRALEEAGLVQRTVYAEVPVKVVYDLTPDGLRLEKVIAAVKELGFWLKEKRTLAFYKIGSNKMSSSYRHFIIE